MTNEPEQFNKYIDEQVDEEIHKFVKCGRKNCKICRDVK